MNESLGATKTIGKEATTECCGEVNRPRTGLDSSVLYGCPSSISGVNTFLLQIDRRVTARFDAMATGLGHIIHIIDSPALFRTAMRQYCRNGSIVEFIKPDGAVFKYPYHEEE